MSKRYTDYDTVMPHSGTDFIDSYYRRFQNSSFTEIKLIKKHNPPKSQIRNIKKQASQITFCLEQASNYLEASRNSPLQIKPLLLYYAITALATADLLWHADGRYSLDAISSRYRNHGLTLKVPNKPDFGLSMEDAKDLVAEVKFGADGKPDGLFGAWWEHSSSDPIIGKDVTKNHIFGATHTSTAALLRTTPDDNSNIRSNISFLDCLRLSPQLMDVCAAYDIDSLLCRGAISRQTIIHNNKNVDTKFQIILYETTPYKAQKIASQIEIDPNISNECIISDYHTGFSIIIPIPYMHHREAFRLSDVFSVSNDLCAYSLARNNINEFGYLFLMTFMLGMLSRYHPHIWMRMFREGGDFLAVCEHTCSLAVNRCKTLFVQSVSEIALFT